MFQKFDLNYNQSLTQINANEQAVSNYRKYINSINSFWIDGTLDFFVSIGKPRSGDGLAVNGLALTNKLLLDIHCSDVAFSARIVKLQNIIDFNIGIPQHWGTVSLFASYGGDTFVTIEAQQDRYDDMLSFYQSIHKVI